MKIQILVCFLFCLIASCTSQWSGSGGISHGNNGPKLNLGLHHTRGRWKFSGSGSTNFGGKWNVGLKATFKFKRSAPLPMFNLSIRANPCRFDLYDQNTDGFITEEEIHAIFENETLTRTLFQALSSGKVNRGITKEVFDIMAPAVITGC
ncbi:uncharacterized protein [Mytilus edulis]|uniref:uncharacterized protein n=1 Tax=Mytilus edulis TaxID=6550 RepID=UPI0039EEBB4B